MIQTLSCIRAVAILAALLTIGAAALADGTTAAKEIHSGEIGLKGTITDADAGQLSMMVTEVLSSTGKPVSLKPAREKSVTYGSGIMRLVDGVTKVDDKVALHDRDIVLAIGPNGAEGEPLEARAIVILVPGTAGLFGFPQAASKVLCDDQNLRVSEWNDAGYLYVQAVIWNPGDTSIGELNGQPAGPYAVLKLDIDGDQKPSPQVDRMYYLDPLPDMPGLHYEIQHSERGWTGLMSDYKGRGAIRYVEQSEGRRIRVDSYVLSLAEIGKKPGESLRLVYYAANPKTTTDLNSCGFTLDGGYDVSQIPMSTFQTVTLAKRSAALDISKVPDGQKDPVKAK